jgi:phytoene/squalene synthetase
MRPVSCCARRWSSATCRTACAGLLKAFRQGVTKHRYADWDELIDYCRYSAMPVGQFVRDVHGENGSIWPASDNVCAVLQITIICRTA